MQRWRARICIVSRSGVSTQRRKRRPSGRFTAIQDRKQRGFGLSPKGFNEFEVATSHRIDDEKFLRVMDPYLLEVGRRPALGSSDVSNQPGGSGQSGVERVRIGTS